MEKGNITTMKDLIDYAADKYKDQPAIKYKKKKEIIEKTYLDLQRDTKAFGNTLEKLDLLGKHIGVIGATSYEWIIAYFGAVNSGSVIIPIDKELVAEDICDLLIRADASALVFDNQYEDIARKIKEGCPDIKYFFNMQQETDSDFALSMQRCLIENIGDFFIPIDCEKLCTILYTSGTTGKSKGVMLCHKNLIDNTISADCEYMKIDPKGASLLSVLPIHHAFCFSCDILLGIYSGICICINDSIMHFAKNIQTFAPSIILVVPMIVESLYQKVIEAIQSAERAPKAMLALKLKTSMKNLSDSESIKKIIIQTAFGGNLKRIFSGGAYLDPEYIKKFKELGIELVQGYGMTECSPRISTNFVDNGKETSVGKLLPGCEGKTVDGEIWVKSKSVMLGYYKNPEETEKTLKDGWLKTGDLGYVDEDGYVYITGRKKNLIILSNGENISPEELENKLNKITLIKEVIVYGENSRITAEVFPDLDYAKDHKIKEVQPVLQEEIDKINENLPLSKRIHSLKIRDNEFEKTTSKKIKRKIN